MTADDEEIGGAAKVVIRCAEPRRRGGRARSARATARPHAPPRTAAGAEWSASRPADRPAPGTHRAPSGSLFALGRPTQRIAGDRDAAGRAVADRSAGASARRHYSVRGLIGGDEAGARHAALSSAAMRRRRACRTPRTRRRGAADRPAAGMVLHDDRARRSEAAAEPPGPHRKIEAVDVRDIGTTGGDGRRTPRAPEDVVNAVPGNPGVTMESLNDGDRPGSGAAQRIAPAGEGEIAVEELVGIGQPLVEGVVNLNDRRRFPASFHLKRRPIDIYCAPRTIVSFFLIQPGRCARWLEESFNPRWWSSRSSCWSA